MEASEINNEKKKKMFDAAESGDLAELQAVVKSVAEGEECLLNSIDHDRTVLHVAGYYGHEHIIRWVLSDGGGRALGFTKVLATSGYGDVALYEAAERGHLACCKAIVEGCKVENGEREKMLNTVGIYGTALHVAGEEGREEVVRWLLSDAEGGGRSLGFTKVLARSRFGATALQITVDARHLACCKAIAEGCKVENGEREEMMNAVTTDGETVLYTAAKTARENVIRWLVSNEEGGGRALGLKSETVTALTADSKSALEKAMMAPPECVEALLTGCTPEERIKLFQAVEKRSGFTALHHATMSLRPISIREILRWEEAKVIVDARDHRGMTALHRMACNGGLDEESRDEWRVMFGFEPPFEDTVRVLIGLDPIVTTATLPPAVVSVDVNAGLEISEETRLAAAAAAAAKEEEKKRRAAFFEEAERDAKQSRS